MEMRRLKCLGEGHEIAINLGSITTTASFTTSGRPLAMAASFQLPTSYSHVCMKSRYPVKDGLGKAIQQQFCSLLKRVVQSWYLSLRKFVFLNVHVVLQEHLGLAVHLDVRHSHEASARSDLHQQMLGMQWQLFIESMSVRPFEGLRYSTNDLLGLGLLPALIEGKKTSSDKRYDTRGFGRSQHSQR